MSILNTLHLKQPLLPASNSGEMGGGAVLGTES